MSREPLIIEEDLLGHRIELGGELPGQHWARWRVDGMRPPGMRRGLASRDEARLFALCSICGEAILGPQASAEELEAFVQALLLTRRRLDERRRGRWTDLLSESFSLFREPGGLAGINHTEPKPELQEVTP